MDNTQTIKQILQNRANSQKCFICERELNPKAENIEGSEGWKRVYNSTFGEVKVHIYHCKS